MTHSVKTIPRLWAALSRRAAWVRLIAGSASAALDGAVPYLASRTTDPIWWCETLHGVLAAVVFLSLSVFRLHGYRLTKTNCPVPAAAAAPLEVA